MDHDIEKLMQEVKEKFCSELFLSTNQMRKDGILCDVVLRVQGQEFKAHRNILCAGSQYFRGLFTNQMEEENKAVIEYKDMEPNVIDSVLNYLYTGEISLNEETAESIVAMADYLIIPSLKDIGTLFLQKQITPHNCFSLYLFGKKYSCKSLEQLTNDYININFQTVCFTDSFKNLDVDVLVEMFQRDNIVISREEVIFEAIQEWVYHDLEARKQYFEKLFTCLRLSSMCKYYLADYVEAEELTKENQLCRDLLFDAFKSLALPDRTITSDTCRPRNCLDKEELGIVVTGGTYLTNQAYHTDCYIPQRNTWLRLANMQYPRDEHVTVVCENLLYSIGGHKKTNTVERYDPRINTWTEVAPLPVKCAEASAVAVDGCIYVIGGRDSFRPYNTLQFYNPANNTWTAKAPMTHRRKALSAVVLDGYIYAIGGVNETGVPLSGVESYDPGLNQWRREAAMTTRRTSACAIVLNRKIFVIGGCENESMTPLTSCEIFDPDKGRWSVLPDLIMPRAAAGVAIFNDKIHVLGGISEFGARADIECYDDEKKKWEVAVIMPGPRAYIQCNVLKIPKQIE